MVVAPVEVAHLRLLLCDLRGRPGAWVGVGRLQAELRGVHVVLLTALDRRGGESSGPPEEDAQHDVSRVVDVEDVLPRHEVLRPEELPKWSAAVVRDLEDAVEASAAARDKFLGLDVPAQRSDRGARQPREEERHGGAAGIAPTPSLSAFPPSCPSVLYPAPIRALNHGAADDFARFCVPRGALRLRPALPGRAGRPRGPDPGEAGRRVLRPVRHRQRHHDGEAGQGGGGRRAEGLGRGPGEDGGCGRPVQRPVQGRRRRLSGRRREEGAR
mmetsp:Transcript_125684/g.391389  ORF Transcript_125684/g.391389 Transcript_125684/m.391389 type:complete len:271 (-) Transcript_125684:246-1058(-)